jgi:hypothetical protein
MGSKFLLAGCAFIVGCGTVVPLQRSERAVIGWGSGYHYCMEPVGTDRAGARSPGAVAERQHQGKWALNVSKIPRGHSPMRLRHFTVNASPSCVRSMAT